MSDEQIRELERRWRETGAPEDRERWQRALIRTRGLSEEWIALGAEVEGHDPERLRAALGELLQTNRLDDAHGHAYQQPIYAQVQQTVARGTGRWFPGLCEELEPPWCPCHWLPRKDADVEKCVARICSQVANVRSHVRSLLALAEEVSAATTSASHLIELAGARLVDLVVVVTGCNDAWYHEVERAVRTLLRCFDGLELDEAAEAELLRLVEVTFKSWSEPSAEVRDGFVLELAVALARDG